MKIRRDPNSKGRLNEGNRVGVLVPIEISARHVHLSKEDFEKLFGKDECLKKIKDLSQPGEFASDKIIDLINRDKEIKKVRILGPLRKNSQVEISMTDAYSLKLEEFPKLRVSGDIADTTLILVKGPKASVKIPCIIAQRHLHCTEADAKKLKIKNNQKISIKTEGSRSVIFNEVTARVSDNYSLSLHLDTDEGNTAGIVGETYGKLINNEKD